MSRIEVGKVYTIDEYIDGSTRARVIKQSGWLFKKYECSVWGVDNDGRYVWPNGNVSTYTNTLTKRELLKLPLSKLQKEGE